MTMYPSYMIMKAFKELVQLGVFGVCVALAAGCASPAKSSAMVPKEFSVTYKHPNSTTLAVTGGKKTNPLWKSDIDSAAFAEAATEAIQKSGVFSSVVNQGGADYKLDITLVKVISPNVGFAMTTTVVTEWRLIDAATQKPLSEEFISTPFRASVGDAFAAVKRLRLANEGAARENIKEGIRRLSELQLHGNTP